MVAELIVGGVALVAGSIYIIVQTFGTAAPATTETAAAGIALIVGLGVLAATNKPTGGDDRIH